MATFPVTDVRLESEIISKKTKKSIRLVNSQNNPDMVLKKIKGALNKHFIASGSSFREVLESASVEALMHMGLPKYFVVFPTGEIAIVDPEDFTVAVRPNSWDGNLVGVYCTNPHRNFWVDFDRTAVDFSTFGEAP